MSNTGAASYRSPIRRNFADLDRGSEPCTGPDLLRWLRHREATRERAKRALETLAYQRALRKARMSKERLRRWREMKRSQRPE